MAGAPVAAPHAAQVHAITENDEVAMRVCDGVPSSKKRGRAAGKKKKRNKTETKGTASTKAAELEDQEKSLDLP